MLKKKIIKFGIHGASGQNLIFPTANCRTTVTLQWTGLYFSSINLCVAKSMCTLLRSEPACLTWLSKPFPRCCLHLSSLQFWHKNPAKFMSNFDVFLGLCFGREKSHPVILSLILTWCAVKYSVQEKVGTENRAQSQRCLLGDPKREWEEGICFAATSCSKKNNCKREASETRRGNVQETEAEGGG